MLMLALIVLLVVVSVMYPMADSLKLQNRGSDQDDCVRVLVNHVFALRAPFGYGTFHDPCSTGPTEFFVYFPVQISTGYFVLVPSLSLLLGVWVLRQAVDLPAAVLLSLTQFSSVLFVQMAVIGSDLIIVGWLFAAAIAHVPEGPADRQRRAHIRGCGLIRALRRQQAASGHGHDCLDGRSARDLRICRLACGRASDVDHYGNLWGQLPHRAVLVYPRTSRPQIRSRGSRPSRRQPPAARYRRRRSCGCGGDCPCSVSDKAVPWPSLLFDECDPNPHSDGGSSDLGSAEKKRGSGQLGGAALLVCRRPGCSTSWLRTGSARSQKSLTCNKVARRRIPTLRRQTFSVASM